MRRMWVIVATMVALGGLLGGCAGQGSRGPVQSAAASKELTPERLYITTIRENPAIDVSGVSDAALLTAAEETCGALDRGTPSIEVLATAVESGGDAGAVIMGTAVGILCREHIEAVEQLG